MTMSLLWFILALLSEAILITLLIYLLYHFTNWLPATIGRWRKRWRWPGARAAGSSAPSAPTDRTSDSTRLTPTPGRATLVVDGVMYWDPRILCWHMTSTSGLDEPGNPGVVDQDEDR